MKAVKEAKEMFNSCLRAGGKVMSFVNAVKGTDAHAAMNDKDPIVIATG